MSPEVKRDLLPFVNQRDFDRFVKIYVDERLDILRRSLEITSDINDIYKTQGQIKEVKRLLTLIEEVREVKKREG